MENILELVNFSASVDEREIVSDVSFSVKPGEIVALLGPNGAGKSTIAASIVGNPHYKTTGKILFNNKDISKLSADKRAKLGIFCTMQNPLEIPGVTTLEMLRMALEAREQKLALPKVKLLVSEACEKLQLSPFFAKRELNVGLSGGEKKYNEMLQLLILKPSLIILDELDSGLDVNASDIISRELAKYQEETGATILVITHNFRILDKLKVSKTIVLNRGKVAEIGDQKLLKQIQEKGFKKYED